MCPADPRLDRLEQEDVEDEAEESSAPNLGALRAKADVEGLLAAARAYRSARDMALCFEAYESAAALGSAEAEYAVALFYMTGSATVAQDLKVGATRLRVAADRGSVPAKVYVGNLYELGVHYKADPDKADVWYRNAARAARVEAEPASEDWERSLAELGCVRHVLRYVERPSTPPEAKTRLLARARLLGHGVRLRESAPDVERPTLVDALAASAEPAASGVEAGRPAVEGRAESAGSATSDAEAARRADAESAGATSKTKARTTKSDEGSVGRGAAAFAYATVFMGAGLGAAYAAAQGAAELVERGHSLPLVHEHAIWLFPIVVVAVGVLPTLLVYRAEAVAKALVGSAIFAGIGSVGWGTGKAILHADRNVQTFSFAIAGFLATLFILGLLGGAKRRTAR